MLKMHGAFYILSRGQLVRQRTFPLYSAAVKAPTDPAGENTLTVANACRRTQHKSGRIPAASKYSFLFALVFKRVDHGDDQICFFIGKPGNVDRLSVFYAQKPIGACVEYRRRFYKNII